MKSYVVATIKPWNIDAFHQFTPDLPGNWTLISEPEALTLDALEEIDPAYIFFPHWSWIVPDEILSAYDCVCFHMTDVPYGRGGSPLQNLIERGHENTVVTALKMTNDLDAGPVYIKKPLSLHGSAQEIFERFAPVSYQCIEHIVKTNPLPEEQKGDITHFQRRTPDMSELPKNGSMQDLYNHIRMLDAQTYPAAFVEHGEFRIEFSDANIDDDQGLSAKIKITKRQNDG